MGTPPVVPPRPSRLNRDDAVPPVPPRPSARSPAPDPARARPVPPPPPPRDAVDSQQTAPALPSRSPASYPTQSGADEDVLPRRSQDPKLPETEQLPAIPPRPSAFVQEEGERRTVGDDVTLMSPKPKLPMETAERRVATVTRTDSRTAASFGIGRVTTHDDELPTPESVKVPEGAADPQHGIDRSSMSIPQHGHERSKGEGDTSHVAEKVMDGAASNTVQFNDGTRGSAGDEAAATHGLPAANEPLKQEPGQEFPRENGQHMPSLGNNDTQASNQEDDSDPEHGLSGEKVKDDLSMLDSAEAMPPSPSNVPPPQRENDDHVDSCADDSLLKTECKDESKPAEEGLKKDAGLQNGTLAKPLAPSRPQTPLRPAKKPTLDSPSLSPSDSQTLAPPQRGEGGAASSPEKLLKPQLPTRPEVPARPQVPARPGQRPGSASSQKPSERAPSPAVPGTSSKPTQLLGFIKSDGSASNETSFPSAVKPIAPERPKSRPQVPDKPKPPVPGRLGGKIAALQSGFMADLNKRLQTGPQAPKKEEVVEKDLTVEKEKAPLADARKGRARGPPRRAPAKAKATSVAPTAAAASSNEIKAGAPGKNGVDKELSNVSSPVTIWVIEPEDGSLVVNSAVSASEASEDVGKVAKDTSTSHTTSEEHATHNSVPDFVFAENPPHNAVNPKTSEPNPTETTAPATQESINPGPSQASSEQLKDLNETSPDTTNKDEAPTMPGSFIESELPDRDKASTVNKSGTTTSEVPVESEKPAVESNAHNQTSMGEAKSNAMGTAEDTDKVSQSLFPDGQTVRHEQQHEQQHEQRHEQQSQSQQPDHADSFIPSGGQAVQPSLNNHDTSSTFPTSQPADHGNGAEPPFDSSQTVAPELVKSSGTILPAAGPTLTSQAFPALQTPQFPSQHDPTLSHLETVDPYSGQPSTETADKS